MRKTEFGILKSFDEYAFNIVFTLKRIYCKTHVSLLLTK